MFVAGVYRAPPSGVRAARGGRAGAGFQVRENEPEATEALPGAAVVAMPSLLAMQEAESAALQDRDARRHGSAMIDELQDLQRSLLGEGGPRLDRLAQLAARPVAAADPGLGGVLRAIQLRASIELARRQVAASR